MVDFQLPEGRCIKFIGNRFVVPMKEMGWWTARLPLEAW